MSIIVTIVAFLNSLMNAIFGLIFEPLMTSLPGWLSNSIISAVVGVLALVIYKYTSNQKALGEIWDKIKGHLLGLILFKDSIAITLKFQWKLFLNLLLLLLHLLKPMAFMIIPVSLILAQLGQWYQAKPLEIGDDCLVTVQASDEVLTNIWLKTSEGFEVTAGPVAMPDVGQICWKVEATQDGTHMMNFKAGSDEFTKKLVVGEGLRKLGFAKAGNDLGAVFMNPSEKPLPVDSAIKSIKIGYPHRQSKTAGTDWWMGYFFVISLIAALAIKPALKVN